MVALLRAVAIRFGNCNNGLQDGGRCMNVNNTATNANWNIGSACFYPRKTFTECHHASFTPLAVEIPLIRHYWSGEWKWFRYRAPG